jgi:hypothetical protein
MAMRFERKLDSMHKLAIPGQRYTDFALNRLAVSMEFRQHRKVQMSDKQHGIATSFSDAKFLVDLVACTCSCGRYQVNDIPCGHAGACIIKLQKDLPLKFSAYRSTYKPTTGTFYPSILPN